MTQPKFKSQIDESSYHAPGGGELYKPLREAIVNQALAQGYDNASMTEHGVDWAADQDPFGHVTNARFPQFVSMCNLRVFETFQEHLKDKFEDLMHARGVGCIVSGTTLSIKRSVSYPDSIIVATRIDEVKATRYHITTTLWSLKEQICVAESSGWMVFYDYSRNRPADLIALGGVYADLKDALVKRAAVSNQK
ncbi:hypothetical protein GGR57DRAFT_513749 [Xylariaceae sp. FL1272]|nr:hypothetical protein GGR57DRAFT_513749 [Xylariaceae sp. FL1272]